MKKKVVKHTEQDLMLAYPIKAKDIGWYFRTTEISNGSWQVEGSDLWGRQVSAQGSDPEKLLSELIIEAGKLNDRITNT